MSLTYNPFEDHHNFSLMGFPFLPTKNPKMEIQQKLKRRKKVASLNINWEEEIENGYWEGVGTQCRIGEKIAQRWKDSCGSPEAELLALAVYEVLGEKLGMSSPVHRSGRVGHNEIRLCRSPEVVAKEVADDYRTSAFQAWRQICLFAARQYGYTQRILENDRISEITLYRGVTGSVAEAIRNKNLQVSRSLVSWADSEREASNFMRRNGDGLLLISHIESKYILAFRDSSTIIHRGEDEYLTICANGEPQQYEVLRGEEESRQGGEDPDDESPFMTAEQEKELEADLIAAALSDKCHHWCNGLCSCETECCWQVNDGHCSKYSEPLPETFVEEDSPEGLGEAFADMQDFFDNLELCHLHDSKTKFCSHMDSNGTCSLKMPFTCNDLEK